MVDARDSKSVAAKTEFTLNSGRNSGILGVNVSIVGRLLMQMANNCVPPQAVLWYKSLTSTF